MFMTKKQRKDHIENIKNILNNNGWILDRYGNFKKIVNNSV